jgi:hypothetical protein
MDMRDTTIRVLAAALGKRGGASRSAAKVEAARANLKRAMVAKAIAAAKRNTEKSSVSTKREVRHAEITVHMPTESVLLTRRANADRSGREIGTTQPV